MKTLYFCRHAKSDRDSPAPSDHDRALNERGQRNAVFMAQRFAGRGEPVQLLVSSTALRARTTAEAFAKALSMQTIILRDDLYLASPRTILAVINDLPATADRVLLFGHNPGFTEAVEQLADEAIGNLPTCGLVRIDLPVDEWSMVSFGLGTLVWMDVPKDHPGQD